MTVAEHTRNAGTLDQPVQQFGRERIGLVSKVAPVE